MIAQIEERRTTDNTLQRGVMSEEGSRMQNWMKQLKLMLAPLALGYPLALGRPEPALTCTSFPKKVLGELKAWAHHSHFAACLDLLLRHMLGRLMSVTERVTELRTTTTRPTGPLHLMRILRYRRVLRACPGGSLAPLCPRFLPLIA